MDEAAANVRVQQGTIEGPTRVQVVIERGASTDPPGQEGRAWMSLHAVAEPTDRVLVTATHAQIERECVEDARMCVHRLAIALTGAGLDNRVGPARVEALGALHTPQLRDPSWLAVSALRSRMYEGHSFGHPVEGREGALATLQMRHLQRFFRDHAVRSTVRVELRGPWTKDEHEGAITAMQALPGTLPADHAMMAPMTLRQSELHLISTASQTGAIAAGRALRGITSSVGLTEALAERGLVPVPPLSDEQRHADISAVGNADSQDHLIDTAVALLSNTDIGPVLVVIVAPDATLLQERFEDRLAAVVQAEHPAPIVHAHRPEGLFR